MYSRGTCETLSASDASNRCQHGVAGISRCRRKSRNVPRRKRNSTGGGSTRDSSTRQKKRHPFGDSAEAITFSALLQGQYREGDLPFRGAAPNREFPPALGRSAVSTSSIPGRSVYWVGEGARHSLATLNFSSDSPPELIDWDSLCTQWSWRLWYHRDNADDHKEPKGYTYVERV